MAVPKRRTSHARKGKRRSHQARHPQELQYCKNCGEPVLPHRICANCGFYREVEVIKPKEKKE